MVHDMINLSFIVKFAKQVFNILILFSWLPQKVIKFQKIEERNRGEKLHKFVHVIKYPVTVDLEIF